MFAIELYVQRHAVHPAHDVHRCVEIVAEPEIQIAVADRGVQTDRHVCRRRGVAVTHGDRHARADRGAVDRRGRLTDTAAVHLNERAAGKTACGQEARGSAGGIADRILIGERFARLHHRAVHMGQRERHIVVAVLGIGRDRFVLGNLDEILLELLRRDLGRRLFHNGLHDAAHALFELLPDDCDRLFQVELLPVHALLKDEFALVVIVGFDARILPLDIKFIEARLKLVLELLELEGIRDLVAARLAVLQQAGQRDIERIDDRDVFAADLDLCLVDHQRDLQILILLHDLGAARLARFAELHAGNIHVVHLCALGEHGKIFHHGNRAALLLRLGRSLAARKAGRQQRPCQQHRRYPNFSAFHFSHSHNRSFLPAADSHRLFPYLFRTAPRRRVFFPIQIYYTRPLPGCKDELLKTV